MLGLALIGMFLFLVFLLLDKKSTKIKVPCVTAGSADAIIDICDELDIENLSFLDWRFILNPKSTFIGRIKGNSMMIRSLVNGDLIFGKKVNPSKFKFKEGDLLVIRITDNARKGFGKLKIREFRKNLNDHQVQTIKYKGEEVINSKPHFRKDIVAIIDRYYHIPQKEECFSVI